MLSKRTTPRQSEPEGMGVPMWAPLLGALMAVTMVAAGCSGGDEAFESARVRPTDDLTHDHSGESSALAPETVQPEDIAELGAGVSAGDQISVWLGVNVCGRFVEMPAGGPLGGLSVDSAGKLVIAPEDGDPTGHDVTLATVMDLIDIRLGTGEMAFGSSWAPQEVTLEDGKLALGDAAFTTGDSCAEDLEDDPGEVQVWYYTPAAVDSGEEIRLVVTDPEDVPVLEEGTAITVAFAPDSSLPTLPPAALVG